MTFFVVQNVHSYPFHISKKITIFVSIFENKKQVVFQKNTLNFKP